MTHCVIYCRQSRTKKGDNGLEEQVKTCRAFCRRRRFKVKKAHKECNKSARGMKNGDSLEKITKKLNKGDVLVVPRVDRISRHYMKGLGFLRYLKSNGINVYSAEEDINLNDNFGEFQKQLKDAEDFSNEMSDTMNKKVRCMARKGWHFGNPAFGYKVCYDHNRVRKIKPDENEQIILGLIFHFISQGDTYATISRKLNSRRLLYRKKWWNDKKVGYVARQMKDRNENLYQREYQ
jgi:site-specific DNA recombinase